MRIEEVHFDLRFLRQPNKMMRALSGEPLSVVSNEPLKFHMYWNSSKYEMGYKHEIAIRSFLKTQPPHYTLDVWVDKEYDNRYGERVRFRLFALEELSKGTPLEGSGVLLLEDDMKWIESDIARLLILYKEGGIFTDFDFIFMKSFEPFAHLERFCYCWPGGYDKLSNAIMKFPVHSEFIKDSLEKLVEKFQAGKIKPGSHDAGRDLISAVAKKHNEKVFVLPFVFFHPEFLSIHLKGWDEVSDTNMTRNHKSSRICYMSYAWHWGNKWADEVEEESKFDLIAKYVLHS